MAGCVRFSSSAEAEGGWKAKFSDPQAHGWAKNPTSADSSLRLSFPQATRQAKANRKLLADFTV